jgi:hypothetical protein
MGRAATRYKLERSSPECLQRCQSSCVVARATMPEDIRYVPDRPISRDELEALVREGLERADDEVVAAWATIQIEAQKWRCPAWEEAGREFWAVGVRNDNVVWYNDVEGGFNTSRMERWGIIGEYWCNQADFSEFLATLPEADASALWQAGSDLALPRELFGKGRIIKAQTSYWTLHAEHAGIWRVRFRGKVETRWQAADYNSVELCTEHPLLHHYNEPWVHLYFKGKPRDLAECEAAISSAVHGASCGWRTIEAYRNSGAPLSEGWGHFLHAPESVVAVVQRELEQQGMTCSQIGRTAAAVSKKVLLLERNFVIADNFRFDRLGP